MSIVFRVFTAIYQHPPTISCGKAKMEAEKQLEMDKETQKKRQGKGSKRTESNIEHIVEANALKHLLA